MEFNGKIRLGSEWDELFIGNDCLSAEAEDFDGKIVKLKYYLSDESIDPGTAVEKMLLTFYEGRTEANGCYMMGSSWTGCYGRHNELEVGGHDIVAELLQHVDKYCYLIIETE